MYSSSCDFALLMEAATRSRTIRRTTHGYGPRAAFLPNEHPWLWATGRHGMLTSVASTSVVGGVSDNHVPHELTRRSIPESDRAHRDLAEPVGRDLEYLDTDSRPARDGRM